MNGDNESYRKFIKDRNDHREEYRRELAQHADPVMAGARDTDRSAIQLGQSVFKTSTLLNGGAIITIPAIVTLFGIDVKPVSEKLIFAGGIFSLGLISAWLSAVFGFFALSYRADREWHEAERNKLQTNLSYYPPSNEPQKMDKIHIDVKHAEDKIEKFRRRFIANRLTAIIFSLFSLLFFIAGNGVGGWTVVHAPLKAVGNQAPISPILMPAPPK